MAPMFSRILTVLAAAVMLISQAQSYAQSTQDLQAPPPFSTAEIEQLVAPVALYPDALLAQVLMAATYPIQIVDAARWRAAQSANLSDQQLSVLTQNQPWDPSVKSLTAFPSVLAMMNDNLDWTGDLGNAFLDQQQDVMDAVQRLRAQAHAAGNLQSGPQQTVVTSGNPPVIVIQPTAPDTVYVPIYNPQVVYGAWPYPGYLPYYWAPPAYSSGGTVLGFTVGLFVGNALWGSMDWHRHDVTINVNRYNRYNRTHITSPHWKRPPHSSRWRRTEYRRNPGQSSRPVVTPHRPDKARPNTHRTRHEQTGTRPNATNPRPNVSNGRPGNTRSNPPGTPSRPGHSAAGARHGNTPQNTRNGQRSTPRQGATTKASASQAPVVTPRATRSRAHPNTQRPSTAPARPNTQRPTATSPRPSVQRTATPQRQRPERPAAAPTRSSTQRPAAMPTRSSTQRPAESSGRRDNPRASSSGKRRGENR